MAGHLTARRPIRALVLFAVALLTSFGLRGAVTRTPAAEKDPLAKSLTLPEDELAALSGVAEFLGRTPGSGLAAAQLVKEIRKQRESFALFASFHTEEERQQALADTPYGREIACAAQEHDVNSLLVASVVEVESTFRPTAGSRKGAVGLMQLLPSTVGLSRKKLEHPTTNLDAGAAYLAELIARFDGNLGLALAAYNAGPTNVRRYNGVPPFPETERYVEKVLSRYVDYHRALWQTSGAAELVAATVS